MPICYYEHEPQDGHGVDCEEEVRKVVEEQARSKADYKIIWSSSVPNRCYLSIGDKGTSFLDENDSRMGVTNFWNLTTELKADRKELTIQEANALMGYDVIAVARKCGFNI